MTLIGPDELASMLGLKRKTVMDLYTRQPGFPAPVTSRRKPRWLADDVQIFLKAKSAQNAHKAL